MNVNIVSADRLYDLTLFIARLQGHSSLTAEECVAILELPAKKLSVSSIGEASVIEDDGVSIYFVASGLCETFQTTTSGKRQVSALHIPGSMINLHSAVCKIAVSTMSAVSASNLLVIPRTSVERLVALHPAVANAFWRDCMVDSAIMMQWIHVLGRRDARSKLSHVFCELAIRYSRGIPPQLSYTFPISQNRLSNTIAITPVHLNRVLRDLREESLVKFENGQVTIQDWKALTRVADFNPGYLIACCSK